MIRDDDIAWARDIVSGKRRGNADAVLARLVLHVHEQDRQPEEDFATRVTRASMEAFEAKHGPMPPLSPPPEAVEWAEWTTRHYTDFMNANALSAARFILQAAGKDTDE